MRRSSISPMSATSRADTFMRDSHKWSTRHAALTSQGSKKARLSEFGCVIPGVALVFGCNIRRADYFLRGANDTDLHQMLITLASHVIDADRDGPKLAVAVDRLPGTG